MIVRNNAIASNANRMLGINNNKISKASEKLSTGYRINRASDDAAGLAVSEKMRWQIRGLDQAARNSQDGISLIQAADGGMQEIHGILQRCRELAVQSSSGTYTDNDREFIQSEVNQLTKEVDRLADDTQFNCYSLLSGKKDKEGNVGTTDSIADSVQSITTTGGVTDKYIYSGTSYASAIVDFSNIKSTGDVANLVDKGFNYTCCTCNKAYSIKFVDGNPNTTRLNDSNPVMEVDVSSITNGTDLVKKIIETAYGQPNFVYNPQVPNLPVGATSFVNHYSQLATDTSGTKLYIYDNRPEMATSTYHWPSGDSGTFKLNVYGEPIQGKDKFFFADIQVGSEEGQTVRLEVQNVTAKQLGVEGLLVSSEKNARSAISKIDKAINKVSSGRATLGAYQNRLEHAINSTNNTSENLQSGESRIRDTDMAKSTMELAKNKILQQATQNMLSQANKMPESIVNLIQQWG